MGTDLPEVARTGAEDVVPLPTSSLHRLELLRPSERSFLSSMVSSLAWLSGVPPPMYPWLILPSSLRRGARRRKCSLLSRLLQRALTLRASWATLTTLSCLKTLSMTPVLVLLMVPLASRLTIPSTRSFHGTTTSGATPTVLLNWLSL